MWNKKTIKWTGIILATISATHLVAEDKKDNPKSSSEFRKRLLEPIDPFMPPKDISQTVSKKDYLNILLEKSVDVRIAHYDFSLAEDSYDIAKANLYLSSLGLNASRSEGSSRSEATPLAPVSKTRSNSDSFGLRAQSSTDWGVTLGANLFTLSHNQSKSDSSDSESSSLGVGADVKLSLLKGAPFFVGGQRGRRADISWELAQDGLKQKTNQLLFDAATKFYDVFQKQASMQITRYSFMSAKALLSDTQELFRYGEVPQSEVTQVELQVAQTEGSLIEAESAYQIALDDMRAFVNAENLMYPKADDIKNLPKRDTYDLEVLYSTAIANRSDYLQQLRAIELNQMDRKASFASTLPSLDLGAQIARSRSGIIRSDAKDDFWKSANSQPTYTLTFTYDFLDRASRQSQRASIIESEKQAISKKNLETRIRKELKAAMETVGSAYRRLEISEKAKGLSTAKLKAEFEKYRLGESGIKNVIDFQREVNSAEIDGMNVRISVLTALANLRRALGLRPTEE